MTELDAAESRFEKGMVEIQKIDHDLIQLNRCFNEGLEAMALFRFENAEVEARLTSTGYTVGPAFTTVMIKDDEMKLKKNWANPEYYIQEEILKEELFDDKNYFDDNNESAQSLEAFKKKATEMKTSPSKKKNEDKQIGQINPDRVFERFGLLNIPPRLHLVKKSFEGVLENALRIANHLQRLHKLD